MFFCVVCSCYNDFRCGISMNGIVHLILYCRKEIFRDLAIKGIIDGSSIDVCNLLIETALSLSIAVGETSNLFAGRLVITTQMEDYYGKENYRGCQIAASGR